MAQERRRHFRRHRRDADVRECDHGGRRELFRGGQQFRRQCHERKRRFDGASAAEHRHATGQSVWRVGQSHRARGHGGRHRAAELPVVSGGRAVGGGRKYFRFHLQHFDHRRTDDE